MTEHELKTALNSYTQSGMDHLEDVRNNEFEPNIVYEGEKPIEFSISKCC